ncbi:MAG: protein kinase [Candidatus Sumerlaeaceae bacterium]|nr:protein kinase [Candidatus Sumerlaeaceae bacterium]
MKVTCPKCSTRVEASVAEGEVVVCPNCAAKLRVRRKAAAAPAAADSTDLADTIPLAQPLCADLPTAEQADAQAEPDAEPDPETLAPGYKLGAYEVAEVVGRGGMATVYRGVESATGTPVAIKVLSRRYSAKPGFVARFEREARVLTDLRHPNIVNILGQGVQDDHYFFAMEFVEGVTLDQLLHVTDLDIGRFKHIIREVCGALTHIHSRGIVHRDIKPANILIDRQGNVKLLDFGVYHVARNGRRASRRGATVGTTRYMAPEQAEDPAQVDSRADIYSLGVTFYRMFTHQYPGSPAVPASQLNTALPAAVDHALDKAMQADVNERYLIVETFCQDLITALDHAPTGATPTPPRGTPLGSGTYQKAMEVPITEVNLPSDGSFSSGSIPAVSQEQLTAFHGPGGRPAPEQSVLVRRLTWLAVFSFGTLVVTAVAVYFILSGLRR